MVRTYHERVPRLVDHVERRRMITDAVRRVIARAGLDAATFQSVAAEAGISVRLVQYYFGSKDELLRATHRAVIQAAAERFVGPPDPGSSALASPRAVLRTVLQMLLPLDADRRDDAVVLAAFHAAALTRADGSGDFLLGAPRVLVDVVAGQLARARGNTVEGGDSESDRELVLDAELVVAAVAGVTQGMLPGFYTDDEARDLVERLLDRVMGPDDAR
jgi:TetR/AcrR family transcriptional repressor of bet genes